MEDLDRQREIKGAADDILRTLDRFGFEWDGEVLYQSRRLEAYEAALASLSRDGFAYPCVCSRSQIVEVAAMGQEGPIYPGTCRSGIVKGSRVRSMRLLTRDETIEVEDRVLGSIRQNPAREVGDFIIRRADGYHAYQLAVVLDDAWQGINQVVRGVDLVSSTPRQCYLQSLLELPRPHYAHLPLVVNEMGRKLSKQHQAVPVEQNHPLDALLRALEFLGQKTPPDRPTDLTDFWHWAIDEWRLGRVPSRGKIPIT
jgi:glutamyl-Q tRNA(Asp) synthetase